MVINVNFTIQTGMSVGDVFVISIPQIGTIDTTDEPHIIEEYPGMPIDFKVIWFGANHTLNFVALKDFPPSRHAFSVGTRELVMKTKVVYQGDSSITYSVTHNGITHYSGLFDRVVPSGFVSSSFDLSNPHGNGPTALDIEFEVETPLRRGELVYVYLPNFIGPAKSRLVMSGLGSDAIRAMWTVRLGQTYILFHIEKSISLARLHISEVNGIVSPSLGANNFTGMPKIALRQLNWDYFAPAPFQNFVPELFLFISNLTYVHPAVAGQHIRMNLVIECAVALSIGDSVTMKLPQFWSSTNDLLAWSDDGHQLEATWSPCTEYLVLTLSQGEPSSQFSIFIDGMRLPIHGVSQKLASGLRLSLKSINGEMDEEPLRHVQLLSNFEQSSLSFYPAKVGVNVTLRLKFQLSNILYNGDIVLVKLPGASVFLSTNTSSIVAPGFQLSWSSFYNELSLQCTESIDAYHVVDILIINSVLLNSQGFPLTNSSEQVLISASGIESTVLPIAFQHLSPVGFQLAEVHYLVELTNNEIGLRFRLHLSGEFRLGDTVTIYCPLVSGTTRSALNVTGDNPEDEFETSFRVSFDATAHTFTLHCLELVPERELNVFIPSGMNNGLYLTGNKFGGTQHYISARVNSTGIISRRELPHFPSSVGEINAVGSVNITDCSFDISCEFEFSVHFTDPVREGDLIAVSHSNFRRNDAEPSVLGFTTYDHKNSVALRGNGSDHFVGAWRRSDDLDDVQLSSDKIVFNSASGHVWASSDVYSHDADVSLPVTFNASVPLRSRVPSVQSLYISSAYQRSVCGDTVLFTVEFDEPVTVLSTTLTLALNTYEYANFFQGNGTSLLQFIYIIDNPQVVVADLSVFGPTAMEFNGPARIVSTKNFKIVANSTLPPPYGKLYRREDGFTSVSVQCNGTTHVSDVFLLSRLRDPYRSGDVVDIGVRFDRPVEVNGVPELLLLGNRSVYSASYVNVSSVQWLDVFRGEIGGYFQLQYLGVGSKCLPWDAPHSTVKSVVEAFSALSAALPVEVFAYSLPLGYRFRIEFFGDAPYLLTLQSLSCVPMAEARLYIDSMMLDTMVFRHVVVEGEVSDHLSYPNNSALVLTNNTSVHIAQLSRVVSADVSLPSPGKNGSLSVNSKVTIDGRRPYVVSVFSNFSTSQGSTIAASGDSIIISVNFSAPVVVFGQPELEIQFSSFIENNFTGQSSYSLNISLLSFHQSVVLFQYAVRVGDKANYLDYLSRYSLHLNGGSILLASSNPTTPASVVLPAKGSTKSLSASEIVVDASTAAALKRIFTDRPAGVYGAGESITITLEFASPVQLIPKVKGKSMSVLLYEPADTRILYVSGSGTKYINFLYTVLPGHSAAPIKFASSHLNWELNLLMGRFQDWAGNQWTNISTVPSDLAPLESISIITTPPRVLFVNSTSPDGTYYPGQGIDVTVVFDKVIVLIGPKPQFEVFMPYQSGQNILAHYTYGNMTKEIHFTYVVPMPNSEVNTYPTVPFDYIDSAALTRNLNGCLMYQNATELVTIADTMLPTTDQSYLAFHRAIFVNFTSAQVVRAYSKNSSGVYTAGDRVVIAVQFTQEVMVFRPPVLRLEVGGSIRNALFVGGNFTRELLFSYLIELGDQSHRLDYVDTRKPPYNKAIYEVSLALDTDLLWSNTGRMFGNINLQRTNDIVLMETFYGGVFSASEFGNFPARTSLPLPGQPGSISFESNIVVDTTPPFVRRVYTPVPSGTYGAGVVIPVFLEFNFPVEVMGCPIVQFVIQSVDRYATYTSGSGTKTLLFTFVVQATDLMTNFDYFQRFSLFNRGCSTAETVRAAQTNDESLFIRRASQNSILDANFTLPWVTYVESVIAPVSITGGQTFINLVGQSRQVVDIFSSVSPTRLYSTGDVIDINIRFNGAVSALQSTTLDVVGLERNLRMETYVDDRTFTMPFVVQVNESISLLTYAGSNALLTENNCDIIDLNLQYCCAQNLPHPAREGDRLSKALIRVSQAVPVVVDVLMQIVDVHLGEDTPLGSNYNVPKVRPSLYTGPVSKPLPCDPLGSSFFYVEVLDFEFNKRTIYTTTCPNHFSVCQDADCVSAVSKAIPSTAAFEVPLFPVLKSNRTATAITTCLTGTVGVALNGVQFYGSADDGTTCEDVVPSIAGSFDKCSGSADTTGKYNYRVPPSCLMKQLGNTAGRHSPQLGWALDGFPIYGGYGPGGVAMQPCGSGSSGSLCLDSCNGFFGTLPGVDSFLYRYYVSGEVASGECSSSVSNAGSCNRAESGCCASSIPKSSSGVYTVGCFAGCQIYDLACQQNKRGVGYLHSYQPVVSKHPTVVYDGTSNTVMSVVDASTKVPTPYLPSPVWDDFVMVPVIRDQQPPPPVLSGSKISFVVSFSEAVVVRGRPSVELFLNNQSVTGKYSAQLSDRTLEFVVIVNQGMVSGLLQCSRLSSVQPNGGQILRAANFAPVQPAELDLGTVCCRDKCSVNANVVRSAPRVVRVYSDQSTTLSKSDELKIYVQFSRPVVVLGDAVIQLNLPGSPNATLVSKVASRILRFKYIIRSQDFASAVDYLGHNALMISSSGVYDGIYLQGSYAPVLANLTLPQKGTTGSLGRESIIIVDNTRADMLSISAYPPFATSGDIITVTIEYSEPVSIVDTFGNVLLTGKSISSAFVTLSIAIVPLTGTTVVRQAELFEIDGLKITYKYIVSNNDPTGSLYIANSAPLNFVDCELISLTTGINGPTTFSLKFLGLVLMQVDNSLPAVIKVYSPNVTTAYPFGIGDVIDIYVEMTLPVIIAQTPYLELLLSNRIVRASYVPTYVTNATGGLELAPFETTLHFRYTVYEGDYVIPLEYNTIYALVGKILRYSTNIASLVANLVLPLTYSPGSLGYCCNVQIDSSRPFVQALLPLKMPGTYGENEEIIIVARFNKPVTVIGEPMLFLRTGAPTNGVAKYIRSFESSDLTMDIQAVDVLFRYVVRKEDNVVSLTHANANALRANGTAAILHKTLSPSTPADLLLRDPSDNSLVSGLVQRQWKYRFPMKVELILRSLYHTQAETLSVNLEHSGQFATVFSGVCKGQTFGKSYPRGRSMTNATVVNADAGIGYTYMFGDTLAKNIAQLGSASLSSLNTPALLAIDGNNDPILGDGSVAQTNEDVNPWWQLLLPPDSNVRSIVVWPRQPQQWVPPIISFTMKALDTYPRGRFKLFMSDISTKDASSTISTGFIAMGATGDAVKEAIEASVGIGKVTVERSQLPVCGAESPGGCGDKFERGYGYTYSITFLNILVPSPKLDIVNIEFIGGEVSNGAFNESSNIQSMILQPHTKVVRTGQYIITKQASTNSSSSGKNIWLTPFWVMLFDADHSPPPVALSSAKAVASWARKVESIGDFVTIVLRAPVTASYLKIQREGYGQLALAEVQVYEEKLNTLNAYDRGSPVEPSALLTPYQPEVSFTQAYAQYEFDGRWLVQVAQSSAAPTLNVGGYSGAYGSISDAVLVITDLIGVVHVYYQDLRAQVLTLPKFGKLYTMVSTTPSAYGDWRQSFEVSPKTEITAVPGLERNLGSCYGNSAQNGMKPFQYCADSFNVGELLDQRIVGSIADANYVRRERMVRYVPRAGYLGPDYFTYMIYDGLNSQYHLMPQDKLGQASGVDSQVTIHVRNCRLVARNLLFNIPSTIHPVCSCAQTEKGMVNRTSTCTSAIHSQCADTSVTRKDLLTMCLACANGLQTGECVAQTIRAVSFLTSLGLCSTAPHADCTTEHITDDNNELFSYISLSPPLTDGTFTALGNGFGGKGWYDSAPLP